MAEFEGYPDLLTTKEAAELLRVHIRTLHRMIARGDIPTFRLPGGRDFRIKKADLLSALERVGVDGEERMRARQAKEPPHP